MSKSAKINVVFFKQFVDTNPIFDWFGIKTNQLYDFSKSTTETKFAVDHKHYKLIMYGANDSIFLDEKFYRKLFDMRRNTVFIFTFLVAESQSYRNILDSWSFARISIDMSHFPIILVGCTDLRPELLRASNEPPITFEMGKQLARRINAVKYLECLSSDKTEFQNIFEEVVSAWILHSEFKRKTWITGVRSCRISVIGNSDSGNFDFVRSFVFGNRMNVVGECMNEQTYFYDITSENFNTCIEIDGEECELEVLAWDFSRPSRDEFLKFRLNTSEIYIFIFSVVNPDSCYAITSNLVENTMKRSDSFAGPVFLIGYQADLRNDAETLETLSKQGKQPITYEMGEELARRIDAAKYMECSSGDVTEIAKVFEEAVWDSLRIFENYRNDAKQKQKFKLLRRYLKRFFKR